MIRFQKIIAAIVLLSTLAFVAPLPWETKEAHAFVPVYEMNPALLGDEGVTAVEQAAGTGQDFYEWGESFVKAIMMKKFLDMLVDQIIQWIQGGGKPQFVTDWRGFLEDAGNQITGEFVQELGLGFLCSPFSLQVQLALLPIGKFDRQAECTLDEIVTNIDNFFLDFRNGGWIAYTTSLQPRNNFFGAVLLAEADLDRRRGNAEIAAQNEAIAGAGFLSTKKCDDNGKNCVLTTPGSTIGGLAVKALGSEIDYIVNADQLEDYAAAIADAAINRLITEGVDGLRGASTPNSPPGSNLGGVGDLCRGLSGTALTSCINMISGSENFNASKAEALRNIRETRTHRLGGDVALQAGLVSFQTYASTTQSFLSQFNSLSCLGQANYIANVIPELTFATTTIPVIQSDIASNQSIISQLDIAENEILAVADGDWATLSILVNKHRQLGIANVSKAVQFEAKALQLISDIQTRSAQKIKEFNRDLQRCQLGF